MGHKRINCWEYQDCGCEPGGKNAEKYGICPASCDKTFDGINSGKCGGRFCWAVEGTFFKGKIQGDYADKKRICENCDFFKMVIAEEGTMNIRTKLLQFVPPFSKHPILNNLSLKQIEKGQRFVAQGSRVDPAYIIRRGSCILLVEKHGRLHPVDHRGDGDIVNMTALFTGEPNTIHAEAETDMEVWEIKKSYFEKIKRNDPDLCNFLTEIVADRFDSKRPVSDRTIGQYTAFDIIGRGGYSIVYRGMDNENKRSVAIKMLRHNMFMDPDFLAMFRNEARIVAGLDHENIVTVFDTQERFQTAFIIMEHIKGESIREMLQKKGPIGSKQAAGLLIQACDALRYAYEKGILHKDISPDNLMKLEKGPLKLMDFGLACTIHDQDDLLDGAMPYLAPEVFSGDAATLESEVYSLGTTAFEMVVGKRPYPEQNPGQFVKLRRTKEIEIPPNMIFKLPKELQEFIIRACRIDPAKRYHSMWDAKDVLEKVLSKNPLMQAKDNNAN